MTVLKFQLAPLDDPSNPVPVDIQRTISLDSLINYASRILNQQVGYLLIRRKRVTDVQQIQTNATVLAGRPEKTCGQWKDNRRSISQKHRTAKENNKDVLALYKPSKSDNNKTIRIIVLGKNGVGKSSFILRFVHGFFKTNKEPTFLETQYEKMIRIEDRQVSLVIYDTSGKTDCLGNMNNEYVTDKHAFLLTVSTEKLNEQALFSCYEKLSKKLKHRAIVVLLITKMDLINGMSNEDKKKTMHQINKIEMFGRKNQLLVFKTSAKTNKKVNEVFFSVVKKCLNPMVAIRYSNAEELKDDYDKKIFLFRVFSRCFRLCY